MKTKLIILGLIAVILGGLGVWSNRQRTPAPVLNSPTVTTVATKIAEGDDYKLFLPIEDNVGFSTTTYRYIDDGLIEKGKYSGYHRILVQISSYSEMGDPAIFFLATKDYKEFVLGGVLGTPTYPYEYRIYYDQYSETFDKSRVTSFDTFPIEHPPVINVGNLVLVRGYVNLDPLSLVNKELASNVPGLRFFSAAYSGDSLKNAANFLQGDMSVYVQDSNGLTFAYLPKTQEQYNRVGSVPYDDNIYLISEFQQSNDLYKSYGTLLPGGCGGMGNSYVLKGISDTDLVEKTTTKSGIKLYALKDQNHPLYLAQYERKIKSTADYFVELNKTPIPDYASYMARNPILVFKDSWGRLIGLGETEYIISGGCGKPVIYLYPTVPTKVNLKFVEPISLTIDIPKYSNGWSVLADPSGSLKDLQPYVTDCSLIDINKNGSEYAKSACEKGIYPYLYWSGQASGMYPEVKNGWLIKREDLNNFLSSKLTKIGLNKNEREDMVNYWIPQMLKKNSPYFRLSFLQTNEMNRFIPMQVTPKPDTVFRIFLDWSPQSDASLSSIQPQTLEKLNRKGFTLVEWGGLKQ